LNKSVRLLGLTHYLGGRRSRSVEEIAGQLSVSPRTAYRYLGDLESQGIPIVKDDYGYKLLPTAKLPLLNLDAEERALLRLALSNPALRASPELSQRLAILKAKLHTATPPEARALDHRTRPVLRLADTPRSGPNAELALEPLRQAARGHRTVELDYDSLSGGQRSRRRLDPHELFERRGAWYLAAHCHHHDEARIFRLDRISDVTLTDQPFTPPPPDASRDLLAHVWSLMHEGGDHTVILRFEPRLAPLVLNARLHPNGVAEELDDRSVRYTVQLDGLEEIARWIVGFGGGCVVEAPGELGTLVREIADGVVRAGNDGYCGGETRRT
jgi:predicted DNA-binding transcriptional regulator YafY